MAGSANDRNLLFGILALQMDIISRDALIAAMNAWAQDKTRPLGQILLEQKALQPDSHALMDALVQKHLALHGQDATQSLATVSLAEPLREVLQQIADPDLRASLVHGGTRFHIIRPHAKGGQGEVFVARDEEIRREVALKEIQEKHADNPNSRARFLREAEITGSLEHPGIVPVYGLGTYANGRPYYAMRLISGVSLKDAIACFHNPSKGVNENRTVAFHQLLRRFVDVCNAISYAHSRNVLHRDLKPSNIILGEYGETFVVDWGLAKSVGKSAPHASAPGVEHPSSGSGVGETAAGTTMGTPAFMSPEQAAGRLDQVGPASDLYSLGATLYCVLTGCVPFEGNVAEILLKVQQGEFPCPRRIKADVPAPLEAICLKAMAREPGQRYDSARALVDDIAHWLADEPVTAWPEPATVKAGRWMRRHKPIVSAAAAAFFVGVLALTSGAIWYENHRAETARKEALAEAETARKQALTEEEIRQALDQAQDARAVCQEKLRRPGGVFELLNRPANWEAQLKLAQAALGRAKAFIANAENAVAPKLTHKANELQKLLGVDDEDRLLALRMEKISTDRAFTYHDRFEAGRKAEAEYAQAFAGAGLAILDAKAADVAARIAASPIKEQLVAALDDWAYVAFHTGTKDMPEKLLAVARQAAPHPLWGDKLRQVDVWRSQLALQALVQNAHTEGLSPHTLSLVGNLLEKGTGLEESWNRKAQARHPEDFWLNFNLAYLLRRKNAAEATGYYWAAIAVRPHSHTAYMNLGNALADQKKYAEAIAAQTRATELDPGSAAAFSNLGTTFVAIGNLPSAIEAYRKAIAIDDKHAAAHYNLGNALRRQKKLSEAIASYERAIERRKDYAAANGNLGHTHRENKDLPRAIAALRRASQIAPDDGDFHAGLGTVLRESGDFQNAADELKKALDLLPKNDPGRKNLQIQLAICRQFLALEKRLLLVIQGKATASAMELLAMARMCLLQKKHATVVELFAKAFAMDSALAKNLENQHRYGAACAAALAGDGQGDEAGKLDVAAKRKLREQSRVWLQADLDIHARRLTEGEAGQVVDTVIQLTHWQANPAFAGVREAKKLGELPPGEELAWRKLWEQVNLLQKQARTAYDETAHKGELTATRREEVYPIKLTAGKKYFIDMESSQFDTLLRLDDAEGKFVEENDDISPTNLNSRIVFTPTASGAYRIVATSFEQRGTGAFSVTVREFAGKK